jgi:thiamine-phosphate pyrophosphorylase
VQRGADYVAFGRFFASRTKPDAPPAALELLARARAQLAVPICAIGGITPHTAAQVIAAGAHWVAAVDAVFGSGDPEAAARAFVAALAKDPA